MMLEGIRDFKDFEDLIKNKGYKFNKKFDDSSETCIKIILYDPFGYRVPFKLDIKYIKEFTAEVLG